MSPNRNLLHDLLQQEQEPFLLRDYISDRRTKLRNSTKHQQLTPSRKPLRETTSNSSSSTIYFPVTFCKNACFSAKHDSPDLTKASPVVYFPKSPVKLLNIPSKTAALLLEAALRIHKNSSTKHARKFLTDFGFFGSVLKKLSLKTHNRNDRGLETTSVRLPIKNIFRRDASRKSASVSGKVGRDLMDLEEVLSDADMDFCSNGRRSDAVWSEDKSLDTETSYSSSNSDVTQFVDERAQSPSRRRSPDFSFLPPSPSRRTVKDVDEEEEEEEKEQCSPVCVLDPLFEDEDDTNENDGYVVECSYASVQRKKHQLLQKLRRFETLADLDPKVLEEMILEDKLYREHNWQRLEGNDDIASQVSDELLGQVLEISGFRDISRIPNDMKRLLSDLMAEEETKDEWLDGRNGVVNTVCAKLDSWKDVQPNTIDMMVDQDFKLESHKWKTNREQVAEVAMGIEFAIFGSLVKELLRELSQ